MLQLNYKLTDEDYIEFNDQYSSYDHFHTSKSRSNVNYW